MNAVSMNNQNKHIKRTVIFLALMAGCFYFGFIIATGLNG